jgi:tetratricopeptide (TPR) repeat protein
VNLVDAMALAAAERVERAAGAKAGLVAYRALAANVAAMGPRGRAVLGALRCAVRISDLAAVSALTARWSSIHEGAYFDEIIALANNLQNGGHPKAATELAEAEVARFRTARALYLFARCLELNGDPAAPGIFSEAATRADNEGAKALATSARVHRIVWLARSHESFATALDEAVAVDLTDAEPWDTLVVCRARLSSPSRFVRAGALSVLEDLAKGPDSQLAEEAMLLGATHADAYADELTALEGDRVASLLRHWPIEGERDASLARLAAVAKMDLFPQSEEVVREASKMGAPLPLASLGLDALRAMQGEKLSEAIAPLREATALVRGARAIPASVWTSAELGLASTSAIVRDDAARLSEALLSEPRKGPRGGFLPLACALDQGGSVELALRAFRAAHTARESGAREALAQSLIARGWKLASMGRRGEAIQALEEGRQLLL